MTTPYTPTYLQPDERCDQCDELAEVALLIEGEERILCHAHAVAFRNSDAY